ncbi:MAG: hypothetical protein NUV61_02620 [Candidatus Azambacteria bacterium]|nr:hypothetical protein [Candidatus Azambacteria bacterium]
MSRIIAHLDMDASSLAHMQASDSLKPLRFSISATGKLEFSHHPFRHPYRDHL